MLFSGITEGNKVTKNTHLFDTEERFMKEVRNLVAFASFAFSSIHALGKLIMKLLLL